MKGVLLFIALAGFCLAQNTICSFSNERDCNAASTTSTIRCQWLTGTTCNGAFGFCFPAAPCNNVVTCARKTENGALVGPAVLFSSGCMPLGFVSVSVEQCRCNDTTPTCPTTCPTCSVCQRDGTCSTPPTPACSADRPCPNNQRCLERNCGSVCVSTCPDGTPQYNCLIDPCSAPRPAGCPDSAVCVSNNCGGCNRNYFMDGREVCLGACSDADCGPRPGIATQQCPDGSVGGFTGRCRRVSNIAPCTWEIRECPVCDPATLAACRDLYCPNGYQTTVTTTAAGVRAECPICQCKPPPSPCAGVQCPAIRCNNTASGENAQPIITEGCCPRCPPTCDSVSCPDIVCPTGFIYQRIPGECCGRCVPRIDCSTVRCANVDPCPTGTAKVRRECCDVCEPILPCANVRCAMDVTNLVCPPGYKPVFRDGQCCPVCEQRPSCANVDCRNVTAASCPTGTRIAIDDLGCCSYCKPVDFCATVLCSQPNCPRESWIRREGQCCPQCPTCRDQTTTVCNGNDDTNCKAGFFTGPDCTTPVPPTDRRVREIFVRLCNSQCASLDVQTIRILVSAISGVDAQFITVELLDAVSVEGVRCCRFKITIAAAVSSGVDVDGSTTRVAAALGATDGWSVETDSSSSASVLASCAALTIAAALL